MGGGFLIVFCIWLAGIAQAQSPAEALRREALDFSRNKQWDQAAEAYRKAISLEPNDPDTHYNLALVYKYKGDPQAARAEFEAAV